jgi:hypothetical protein
MRRDSVEMRRIADWLEAGDFTDASRALQLPMSPRQKACGLMALAARFPKQRAALIELAEKLNYELSFPHNEIADTLTALKGDAEAARTGAAPAGDPSRHVLEPGSDVPKSVMLARGPAR